MKTLTINKNSLSFWLATLVKYEVPFTKTYSDGVTFQYGDSGDICTYSKYVFGGAILASIIAVVIAGAGFLLWHIIFGIYFSLILGQLFFSEIATTMILVVGIFGGAAFVVWCVMIAENYIKRHKYDTEPTPGFIKNAYRSWKGKYCVKLEFKD